MIDMAGLIGPSSLFVLAAAMFAIPWISALRLDQHRKALPFTSTDADVDGQTEAAQSSVGKTSSEQLALNSKLGEPEMLTAVYRHYGFSPVEAMLVEHILAGETLTYAASKMRVKESTVRGYLKQVFAKTGAKRQVELVALISGILRTRKINPEEEIEPGQKLPARRYLR